MIPKEKQFDGQRFTKYSIEQKLDASTSHKFLNHKKHDKIIRKAQVINH